MSDTFTKFDFNNDFFEVVPKGVKGANAPIQAPSAPKPRAPRTFKEAGEQGYEKGLIQGRAEGQAEAQKMMEQRFNQQAQQLTAALEELQDTHQTALKDLESNLLGLIRYSLGKMLGHAQSYYTEDILKEHMTDILREAQNAQSLTLKVNPNSTPMHEDLVNNQSAPDMPSGTSVRVEGNPALGPCDVALEWETGGLEKIIPQQFKRLDTLLQSAGASTAREDFSPTDAATLEEEKRIQALLGEDDDLVPDLQEEIQEAQEKLDSPSENA